MLRFLLRIGQSENLSHPHFPTTQNEWQLQIPHEYLWSQLNREHAFCTSQSGDGLLAALQPNSFILFTNTLLACKVLQLYVVQKLKYLATLVHMPQSVLERVAKR